MKRLLLLIALSLSTASATVYDYGTMTFDTLYLNGDTTHTTTDNLGVWRSWLDSVMVAHDSVLYADTAGIAKNSKLLQGKDTTWVKSQDGSVDTLKRGYGFYARGTWAHSGESLAVNDTIIPNFTDLMDSIGAYSGDLVIAGPMIEIHSDTAGHERISFDKAVGDTHYLAIGGKAADATKADSALVSASTHALPDSNKTNPTVVSATRFRGAVIGNVTGNASGSSGSCTGQAATVATIAGLTADTTAGGAARATLAANATQLAGHDSTYYLPGILRTIEVDDFTAGLTSSTAVGDLGWPTTGSIAEKAGEANHPGILTLSTTAIANAVSSLQRNFMYLTDEGRVSLLMQPLSGSTVMGFRFGLLDTQLTLETSKGVYFSFLAESSANWRTVTRDGSGITRNTSATAYTPGSWYLLEIVKSGTDYLFYINSVLKATHTTNIYAGSVRPMIVLLTREAVAKSVDLDWYYSGTGTLTR